MTDRKYKALVAGHGEAEIAADFVFPVAGKENAKDTALSAALKARRVATTAEDKLRLNLLQLRYQIEDYIRDTEYDDALSFQYFLGAYINDLGIKRNELAYDLDIAPSALSQYLNAHRLPPVEVLVRLELHCARIIPAGHWYQLIEKEKIHQLNSDKKLRTEQMTYIRKSKHRVKLAQD